MFNGIVIGQVTAQQPPFGLQIVFKMTGQMVSAPVVLGRDWIDPLRVRQKPMPVAGTWGVILFPEGDMRNGIWITSLAPSFMDALNYTGDATDPFMDYTAHFSGHWELLDGKGNLATEYADGSTLVIGATSGVPTVYRHIVDANQNQITQEFTRAERIPNPPDPFYTAFTHKSGTTISIDPSGNLTASGASGTTAVVTFENVIVNGNFVVNA